MIASHLASVLDHPDHLARDLNWLEKKPLSVAVILNLLSLWLRHCFVTRHRCVNDLARVLQIPIARLHGLLLEMG